jgi:hypothetical protein
MSDDLSIDEIRRALEGTPEGVIPLDRARSKRQETTSELFDPTPSSWIPTPLGTEYTEEEPPSILKMSNGKGLLYRGRTHAISGESSSGKTWIAVLACSEVLNAGGSVLWIDYESTRNEFIGRLSAMGVPVELWSRVTHLSPEHPLWDDNKKAGTIHSVNLAQLINESPFDLAIIDTVTGAMSVEGLDPNTGTDVETLYRILPGKLAKSGTAVLMLDHVTKNTDSRGKYAIGSERKLSGVTGASYNLKTTNPWKRATMTPLTGSFDLVIAKDRAGHIGSTGETITTGIVTSDPDGGLRIKLMPPDDTTLIPPIKRLREILDYLKSYDGASGGAIEKSVKGNSESIRDALKYLVSVGALAVTKSGQGHYHYRNEQRIKELDY